MIAVASDVHTGSVPDGDVATRRKVEGIGAHRMYSRGVAEAPGGTAPGGGDRAGGLDQRLLRDERAGGGGMAGAGSLGAYGRNRQLTQAEVGSAGQRGD